MKSLLLIRHAKSSWENFSVPDFDRPLNDRGKRDAPMMAERLKLKNVVADKVLVSTAKRARKTAEHFIEAWNTKESAIEFRDELYLASPSAFKKVLSKLPDTDNCVAVFSHNHGLTEFANDLTDVAIDNIPTCGIFAIHIKSDKWSDFAEAEKEFWFFDAPKNPVE
ncbi:MAG: histidine phosphatase family protein [Chitinophagaceae bacterium]|nr:histidine phosphatase family protein [Chitinophagaceae bacterium]